MDQEDFERSSQASSTDSGESRLSGKKKGRTGKKKKDSHKTKTKTAPDPDHPKGSLKIVIILDPKDFIRLFACGGKFKSSISCKCAPKESKNHVQKVDENLESSESSGFEGDAENTTIGHHENSEKSQDISSSKLSTIAVIENELAISGSNSDAERASDIKYCQKCKTWFHPNQMGMSCKMNQLKLGSGNNGPSDGSDIQGPSTTCKSKLDGLPYCAKCQMWMNGQRMQPEGLTGYSRPSEDEEKGFHDVRVARISSQSPSQMVYCPNCQLWFSECIIQDGQEAPFMVSADRVIVIEDAEFAERPVASDASMPSNALIYCPLCQTWLENYILQDGSTGSDAQQRYESWEPPAGELVYCDNCHIFLPGHLRMP